MATNDKPTHHTLALILVALLSLHCGTAAVSPRATRVGASFPLPAACSDNAQCDTTAQVVATNITGCQATIPLCSQLPPSPPCQPTDENCQYPMQWEVWQASLSQPTLGQTLTMQKACADRTLLPGFQNPQYMYAGSGGGKILPPLMRLTPGNTIGVTLQNQTQANDLYAFPFTNIHYHGMNVSPGLTSQQQYPYTQPYGDNVLVEVPPGAPASYSIPIPSTHPQGMFWYHPHPHGGTESQVLGGLSGLVVVDDIVGTYYPDLQSVAATAGFEQFLLLKDYVPSDDCNLIGPGCAVKSVNGMTFGTLTLRPDTPQLLRIANVGANQFFDLQIRSGATADTAMQLYIIAVDGNPVFCTDVDGHTYACTIPVTDLFLPSGARMDVLVQLPAPSSGTAYGLWTNAVDTGTGGDLNCEQQLGWVQIAGSAVSNAPDLSTLTSNVDVPNRFTADELRAQMGKGEPPPCSAQPLTIPFTETAGPNGPIFSIKQDGTVYQPSDPALKMKVPCIAEWNVTNNTTTDPGLMESHVFHVHQVDFLWEAETLCPSSGPRKQCVVYRDTLTVNSGPGDNAQTILIPFTDPVILGNFVYHCHILNHEDLGMMANLCAYSDDTPCPPLPPPAPVGGGHGHTKH